MKKIVILTPAIAILIVCVVGVAAAATGGSASVTFTVLPTQELTADSLPLGSVSAGINSLGSKTPVTVSSNTAWKVMAQADGNYVAGAQSIPAGNLALGGNGLSTTSTVQIASGGAGQGLNPAVTTTLNVPWTIDPGVSSAFSGSVTYSIMPN